MRPPTDIEGLGKRLGALGPRVQEAVAKVTADHAAFLLERMKDNAPVQTGELRDSGRVALDPDSTPEAPSALVVFDAPHALAVHERDPGEDQAHQDETTPEGHRGRKFATRPLEFHQPTFAADVATATRTAMEKAR